MLKFKRLERQISGITFIRYAQIQKIGTTVFWNNLHVRQYSKLTKLVALKIRNMQFTYE